MTPRFLQSPPTNIPMLQWWKGHYEKVFLALNPFVRMPVSDEMTDPEITIVDGVRYLRADWQAHDDIGKDLFDHAKQHGWRVSWSDVHEATCPEVPFMEFGKCVWISACLGRRDDVPRKTQEAIEEYCEANALFLPLDDMVCPTLEPQMNRFLADAGLETVDAYSPYDGNKHKLDVSAFSKDHRHQYLDNHRSRDRIGCIHSEEIGLLMAWEFDGVEARIALSDRATKVATPENFFEGFYVDDQTYTDWLNPLDFCPRDGSG